MKYLLFLMLLLLSGFVSFAQEDATPAPVSRDERVAGTADADAPKYHVAWKYEAVPTIALMAWTGYTFSKVYNKPPSDSNTIKALNKDDLPFFDRWGAGKNDNAADKFSDNFLYGAPILPFFLLLDKGVRHEAPKIGFMYVEAMAITGSIYGGFNYLLNRYRPETYDVNTPVGERVDGNYKNSFPAGHVATVATATFFGATVYAHYHPNQHGKYYLYGGAIALTGVTIYLRHEAGKHFPSDLAAGTALGVLSGVLVPYFHLNSRHKGGERAWNIYPDAQYGGTGLGFCYRFK